MAPAFGFAAAGVAGLGLFDAMGVSLRHAVLQGETPDELRGRVTSTHHVFSRGGSALGQVQLGALATLVGAPAALVAGGLVTAAFAAGTGIVGPLRRYEAPVVREAKR